MCWSHMIHKCRKHRDLVAKSQWETIDADIHALPLSFSDEVFPSGAALHIKKWSEDASLKRFSEYFIDQWLVKLPYW